MEAILTASHMPKSLAPFVVRLANRLMGWDSFHNIPLSNAVLVVEHFGYSVDLILMEWSNS